MEPHRVYLPRGTVTHLVEGLSSLNDFPYTEAACGVSPMWPAPWLGEGSQSEYDQAADLPMCRRCSAKVPQTRREVSAQSG